MIYQLIKESEDDKQIKASPYIKLQLTKKSDEIKVLRSLLNKITYELGTRFRTIFSLDDEEFSWQKNVHILLKEVDVMTSGELEEEYGKGFYFILYVRPISEVYENALRRIR